MQGIQYSPWLVAAIKLKRTARFTATHWDNVYDSPSLGYISPRPQNPLGNPAPVLTYYLPFVENLPEARQDLLKADHRRWVEFIVHDLGQADRSLTESIERIDLYVGDMACRDRFRVLFGVERRRGGAKHRKRLLASCDRTGLPFFEEAVFTGVLAAEEAMDYLGHSYTTSIGEYAKRNDPPPPRLGIFILFAAIFTAAGCAIIYELLIGSTSLYFLEEALSSFPSLWDFSLCHGNRLLGLPLDRRKFNHSIYTG